MALIPHRAVVGSCVFGYWYLRNKERLRVEAEQDARAAQRLASTKNSSDEDAGAPVAFDRSNRTSQQMQQLSKESRAHLLS